ncbi:MAG: hypothetical protein AB9856_00965 [Cellulosilyticaceae bacterium]
MPLIKCPMCQKDISPNAISCPHCGEPMKKEEVSEDKYNVVLLSCDEYNENSISVLCKTIDLPQYIVNGLINRIPTVIKTYDTYEQAVGIKDILEREGIAVRVEVAKNKPKENVSNGKTSQNVSSTIPNNIHNANIIKIRCPNCNSTQTHKISGISKAGSAALFGVFSLGKLNKTYECNSCKYRW